MQTSPYRCAGPTQRAVPPPLALPVRSRRPGLLLSRALAGSLLVHAALLGSAAALPPSPGPLPAKAPAPPYGGNAVLVVLRPGLDTEWSPPPPLQACFDASEIEAALI